MSHCENESDREKREKIKRADFELKQNIHEEMRKAMLMRLDKTFVCLSWLRLLI